MREVRSGGRGPRSKGWTPASRGLPAPPEPWSQRTRVSTSAHPKMLRGRACVTCGTAPGRGPEESRPPGSSEPEQALSSLPALSSAPLLPCDGALVSGRAGQCRRTGSGESWPFSPSLRLSHPGMLAEPCRPLQTPGTSTPHGRCSTSWLLHFPRPGRAAADCGSSGAPSGSSGFRPTALQLSRPFRPLSS